MLQCLSSNLPIFGKDNLQKKTMLSLHTCSLVILDAAVKRWLIPGPKPGLLLLTHSPCSCHTSYACKSNHSDRARSSVQHVWSELGITTAPSCVHCQPQCQMTKCLGNSLRNRISAALSDVMPRWWTWLQTASVRSYPDSKIRRGQLKSCLIHTQGMAVIRRPGCQ